MQCVYFLCDKRFYFFQGKPSERTSNKTQSNWPHDGAVRQYFYHASLKRILTLPGVLGNKGIRPFISGEQGNKSPKLKGTGEQRQVWGTGNIENQDFDFREQGKMLIFFKGTGIPPGRASILADSIDRLIEPQNMASDQCLHRSPLE